MPSKKNTTPRSEKDSSGKKLAKKSAKKPVIITAKNQKTLPSRNNYTPKEIEVNTSKLAKKKEFQALLDDMIAGIDIDVDDLDDDQLAAWEDFQDEIKPTLAKKNWALWTAIFSPVILPGIVKGMRSEPTVPQPKVIIKGRQQEVTPPTEPRKIVDYAQEYFKDHGLELCKSLTETDLARLKDDLKNNWGKGPDAFAEAFKESYPVSKSRLETIYRSERHMAEYYGVQKRAEDAGHSYKQYRAVGDERSCDLCMSFDMEIKPINEPFSNGNMGPSSHPNCRCSMITLTDDEFNEMPDEQIYQDASYLNEVTDFIKLNYKCKRGTIDDSYSCEGRFNKVDNKTGLTIERRHGKYQYLKEREIDTEEYHGYDILSEEESKLLDITNDIKKNPDIAKVINDVEFYGGTINRYLLKDKNLKLDDKLTELSNRSIKVLDEVFKDPRLSDHSDMILYRGITRKLTKEMDEKYHITDHGSIFQNEAYTFATATPELADYFSNTSYKSSILEIKIPRGIPVLYTGENFREIEPELSETEIDEYTGGTPFREFILPRKLNFKVSSVRKERAYLPDGHFNDRYRIIIEVLQDKQKQDAFYLSDVAEQFKLNYKCRKEDSPDGSSNKCPNTKNDLSSKKSDIKITVPAGIMPPGTSAAEIGSKFKQPSGAPIRGTIIDVNDPKIPEFLYHFTTRGEAVARDGVLRAGGVGGLGGDRRDQIVSMTTDPEIANALKNDMIFAAKYGKAVTDNPPPPREWNDQKKVWEGDRTEWFNTVVAPLLKQKANDDGFTKFDPNNDILIVPESYGPDDHLRSYFQSRESGNRELGKETPTKFKNPLIYTDSSELAKINPDDIKVVSIPKKNLDQGQLLTDFDLDNPFGLKEIRSYGDIPLETPVKLNEIDNRNNQTCIYLNEVYDFMKLNKKCKVGTFDDSNKCGPEKENTAKDSLINLPLGKPDFSGTAIQVSRDVGMPNEMYRQELGNEVTQALNKYRNTDYIGINSYLRTGNVKGQDENMVQKQILLIDSAFTKKTSEPITTFRVVRGQDIINKYKPGTEVDEKAYLSTTISGGVGFFGADSENAISLQIEVPKGTPFVDVSKAVSGVENELLLPRNGTLKIIEVKEIKQQIYNLDNTGNYVPSEVTRKYARVEFIPKNTSSFQEVSSSFNPELGGFHTTDYKTVNNKPVRVISQDKADNPKLLEAIKDLDVTTLPSQFMVMKMKAGTPAKYYTKTDSIGVDKNLSSSEMAAEIKKVLASMKTNSRYLEEVSDFIKLNYRCEFNGTDYKCGTENGPTNDHKEIAMYSRPSNGKSESGLEFYARLWKIDQETLDLINEKVVDSPEYNLFNKLGDKWLKGIDPESREDAIKVVQDNKLLKSYLLHQQFGLDIPEKTTIYRVGRALTGMTNSFFPNRKAAESYQKRMGIDSIYEYEVPTKDIIPSMSGAGEIWVPGDVEEINEVKHNKSYLQEAADYLILHNAAKISTSMLLNRQGKCKKGTVDDSFKCSDEEPTKEPSQEFLGFKVDRDFSKDNVDTRNIKRSEFINVVMPELQQKLNSLSNNLDSITTNSDKITLEKYSNNAYQDINEYLTG